jgi:hypothetical protein
MLSSYFAVANDCISDLKVSSEIKPEQPVESLNREVDLGWVHGNVDWLRSERDTGHEGS